MGIEPFGWGFVFRVFWGIGWGYTRFTHGGGWCFLGVGAGFGVDVWGAGCWMRG